ncbi:MAG: UpxY family transcription antiterminator [Chitinophagaceae bacterium]|nr:UpxY family transcription antiterminator [Chitinophagaceae bacterium]
MSTSKNWYVVYTRPKWEKKVSQILSGKSLVNYCPLNKVQKQWSDRKKIVMEPLFTSYVFVHASVSDHAIIRQSDGIINFVYWLGNPAIVREEEIETIRKFLNEYKLVTLEKLFVNINDNIRITSGPLMDIQGKVIEIKTRTVKVYLPTLGYQMIAEVEKSSIEILASEGLAHPLAS